MNEIELALQRLIEFPKLTMDQMKALTMLNWAEIDRAIEVAKVLIDQDLLHPDALSAVEETIGVYPL